MRLLEERHPEVTFDWTKILREPPQQLSEGEATRRRDQRDSREARRRRKRTPEEEPVGRHVARQPPEAMEFEAADVREAAELGPPAELDEPAVPEGPLDRAGREDPDDGDEFAGPQGSDEPGERGELEERDEGAEPDERAELEEPAEPVERRQPSSPAAAPSAASELVGTDGAARLRNRYVVLRQRIERIADETRREQLRADAAALDPDRWITVESARAALDTYEARYEVLRSQVGGGRRRRRRRRGGGAASGTKQRE